MATDPTGASADVHVPHAATVSMAALLAQAGKPFTIDHDLISSLELSCQAGLQQTLLQSSLASQADWYALISPDGVVGQYNREKWGVEIETGDGTKTEGNVSPVELSWLPLAGQSAEAASASTPPRHVTTQNLSLEEAIAIWLDQPGCCCGIARSFPQRHVYLRGILGAAASLECLRDSIFQEMLETSFFGSKDFAVSLYASQQQLQTNLHVDEHSGFLVQLHNRKRVVLFSRKASRSLRCTRWGDPDAPVNRRSWFHDGVPDEPTWKEAEAFRGLGGCEVEVGPGQALFIPKGYFHDVLSRDAFTFGLVLRCHD